MTQKTCKISWKTFTIDLWEADFLEKISPTFGWKKYIVPEPTLCPTERMIRRLGFRNERSLFYRKCDMTGKQIVAQYPTNSEYTVYDKSVWFSDDWDASSYGVDFDFSRPFFPQFRELMLRVPRMARVQQGNIENSEFCNRASDCKNCYLLYSSNNNEDSYYGAFINDGFQCIDNTNVYGCHVCYESVDCYDCQRVFWCEECKNCSDFYFLKSCVGCRDCLFCTNLTQKQYCIMNKQLTKEEYEKQISTTDFSNQKLLLKLKKTFEDIKKNMFVKYFSWVKNENVSGDHIDSSKNALEIFDSKGLEDCRYCQSIFHSKNCMDFCYWWQESSWIYEVHAAGRGCSNMLFCNESWDNNKNLIYCDQCMFSSDLFGCCGIRHGRNAIFNKHYSQADYEALCGRIIDHMKSTGEWGEFFPLNLSPFGYNETVAQDYFPLSEGDAKMKWYKWKLDDEVSSYHGDFYQPLPIEQYDEKKVGYDVAQKNIDECVEWIIECQTTKKPFKIIKPELAFYIEHHLPLPILYPNERHRLRTLVRNPRIMHERECDECSCCLETVYAPDRTENVLCESCFQKRIFS
jgi:hypothetical protein